MDKEYLFKVKIFYKNGNYKYANLFKKENYDMGVKLGTILRYRKMNIFEKLFFRHCL